MISNLDNNKLSKSGGVMTGAITAIRETQVSLTNDNIDLATGNVFTKTISGDTTFTVSNVLPTGNVNSFMLELINGGSGIITWFAGVKWSNGEAPELVETGKDVLGFYSYDGGVNWVGLVHKDIK